MGGGAVQNLRRLVGRNMGCVMNNFGRSILYARCAVAWCAVAHHATDLKMHLCNFVLAVSAIGANIASGGFR
ncbi:Os04g0583650 [Oryza sativa Japonica Group]|uniref:Os04g0583650 protein n=1 Tax=Oryza sativa subsp. japonica TaxID=39947 RepID=A0A0P0WE62_ORYSJ|nr:Os04g0583650 [Oryza sativa Japonica Group]